MTEWINQGIILSVRPYQEKGVIVAALTEEHGRCHGFAYDNRAMRQAGAFEIGSLVNIRWTGRAADQLGRFDLEPVIWHGADLFDCPAGLMALRSMAAMLDVMLPERESCPDIFGATAALLPLLVEEFGLALYVKWESLLLATAGVPLGLSSCAVTGRNDHLAYVSPRTGRAVSLSGAEGYEDKLLPLPGFLIGGADTSMAAISQGLSLMGHFLQRHVFDTVHQSMPNARQQLVDFCAARA